MKSIVIRLLILLLVFVSGPASSLTVALDDNYPPYSFRDSDGDLLGISVDLWNLWSRKTGEPVELTGRPWSETLDAMENGRADVLDTVFLTPSRQKRWLFSDPYASIKTAVFRRDGLVGILGPKDLKNYTVGIKRGDASADGLRDIGIKLVEFSDYGTLVDAALRGEILIFCMDIPPATHFLLAKGGITQFRQAFVLSFDNFRRAVSLEKPEILARVNRGYSLISADEKQSIERRWLGNPISEDPHVEWIAAGVAVAGLAVCILFLLRRRLRRGELAAVEERLKLSEDRTRALFSALPDLLYIINLDGEILETLAPVRNHLYHDPERFVGKRIGEVFGAAVGVEARARMEELEKSGGLASVEADLDIRGELRTFEARIVRLADGRFLSIVRDVSDTRRAWRDDLHRNKLESLGLLAGGLAHDFNNSLAVIQGFVSLARVQLGDPPKALASLDKAVQATRRASGLTSQLRVLAHGGEVHRSLLSVRTLAEEAAAFALVGSPCLLAVEADSGPWTVEADPDQLSQVFHNLVLNAVQAMPSGGTVTLVFRHTGERILVSVVDQGAGISPEGLKHIFDPYFTTKPKGTGLGLPVVQAVVQRHGGKLEVDSREGRGTAFSVSLPAAVGEPAIATKTSLEFPAQFAGQRALVMEDDADLRELLASICTSLGFEPTVSRNGTEALAAFVKAEAEKREFALVVSDLLVPGDMGGRELISRLRSRTTRFRALAVTGFSVDRSVEDFRDEGFDVIVGKPFTVDEMKMRIVELMKKPWKTAPNT